MAKKVIHPVPANQIVSVFSDLADEILVRHAATNDLKRNTHVVFGASPYLTSAILAETALVDRFLPVTPLTLTFELPEKKFPYKFAATAQQKPKAYKIKKSPLKDLANGMPQSVLLMNALHNGVQAHFIDINMIQSGPGKSFIDVEFLSKKRRPYIDDYITTVQGDEFDELTKNWLNPAGAELEANSIAGHNLRADYMRQNITHEVDKDSNALHVHVGSLPFTDIKDEQDFLVRKRTRSLPHLLHRRDPGANIIVINCVTHTSIARLQAAKDFRMGHLQILNFDVPSYPAWAGRQDEGMEPATKEQVFWDWLCVENKAMKYGY